jgi:hypothetical protein
MPARIARVLRRDAAGLSFECRGEKEGLAVTRHLGHDPVDRRPEAHVEHAIRLVEGEHAHAVEPHSPAGDQVLEPSRRGDHDVGLPGQLGLLLETDPAVDGGDRERARCRERPYLLDDLADELARRREHQRGRPFVGGLDQIDEGDAERERLTRPGRRLHQHVVAGERVGYDRRLDRKGRFDASLGETTCDHRRDAEIGKGFRVHSAPDNGRSETAASYLGDSPDPDRYCHRRREPRGRRRHPHRGP